MASLVRGHPKTAMLAAAATCFICLPILFPLLLISSPFLVFTSLFSVGLMTLFRSLLRLIHLSFSLQRRITGNNKRRVRVQEFAGNDRYGSLEDVHMREGFLKQSRVHEYLEDQLKNLNVEALERSESGEDPLPCSFSFGPLESLNASFSCHEEGRFK